MQYRIRPEHGEDSSTTIRFGLANLCNVYLLRNLQEIVEPEEEEAGWTARMQRLLQEVYPTALDHYES